MPTEASCFLLCTKECLDHITSSTGPKTLLTWECVSTTSKFKAWAQDHPLSLLLGQQLRPRPKLGGDVFSLQFTAEAEHVSRHPRNRWMAPPPTPNSAVSRVGVLAGLPSSPLLVRTMGRCRFRVANLLPLISGPGCHGCTVSGCWADTLGKSSADLQRKSLALDNTSIRALWLEMSFVECQPWKHSVSFT